MSRSYAKGGYVASGIWQMMPASSVTMSLHTGEPETPLPVEYTAQAIRGYRTWNIRPANIMALQGIAPGLWPLSIRDQDCWASPITHARCGAPGTMKHTAPGRDCRCGLYAWHRPDTESLRGALILGVVEGAGRVLWGCRGWRAEKARIVAIWADDAVVREMIAATYPEAKLYETREALQSDWPPHVAETPPEPPDPFAAAVQFLNDNIRSVEASLKRMGDAFKTYPRPGLSGLAATSVILDEPTLGPRERALELRRNRNTGPAKPRMDGRKAR